MDFHGLERVLRSHPRRRAATGHARHARAVSLLSRDSQRPAVRISGRRAARGAADPGGVRARRASGPGGPDDIGALDADAIARVRDEARPDPRDADELHDAMVTIGFLPDDETHGVPGALFERADSRAVAWRAPSVEAPVRLGRGRAAARVAGRASRVVARSGDCGPGRSRRARLVARGGDRRAAARTAGDRPDRRRGGARSVVGHSGVGGGQRAPRSRRAGRRAARAVHRRFPTRLEWCDRRLLARIHRYTLNRLRAEIEPVNAADFMRFLFAWQHVHPAHQLTGADGLRAIVARWMDSSCRRRPGSAHVLPARLDRYEPPMLDMLCLTGQAGWGAPVGGRAGWWKRPSDARRLVSARSCRRVAVVALRRSGRSRRPGAPSERRRAPRADDAANAGGVVSPGSGHELRARRGVPDKRHRDARGPRARDVGRLCGRPRDCARVEAAARLVRSPSRPRRTLVGDSRRGDGLARRVPSTSRPGRCSVAMGWSSAGCSRARPTR